MLLWFWHTARVTRMGFHVTVCLCVTLMGSLTTCSRLCWSDLSARVSWKQQRWAETGTTGSLIPVTFNASPSLVSSPESSFTWSKRWFLHPSGCCFDVAGSYGKPGRNCLPLAFNLYVLADKDKLFLIRPFIHIHFILWDTNKCKCN